MSFLTLLLIVLGLAALVVVSVVARIIWLCAAYSELPSEWISHTPPERPTLLTKPQAIFVGGFALGAVTSVAGAWLILNVLL